MMRLAVLALIVLVPVSWFVGRDLLDRIWPEEKEENDGTEARGDVHDGR